MGIWPYQPRMIKILLPCFLVGAEMSVLATQLINKFGQIQEVIRFGCIVVGSITHLLSMCLPGQLLLDKSIGVFDKAQVSKPCFNLHPLIISSINYYNYYKC
ncbi:hypothetical protein EAG_00784 [Camponotus floridanus]|uniref:Uncharacterized protein n=1 Tax=Camponotus floridanus TaxID=104421 RepID=E2AN87_CAMFO|nr:hypothetical protein EAG_00784 [Camponotus floridanus]